VTRSKLEQALFTIAASLLVASCGSRTPLDEGRGSSIDEGKTQDAADTPPDAPAEPVMAGGAGGASSRRATNRSAEGRSKFPAQDLPPRNASASARPPITTASMASAARESLSCCAQCYATETRLAHEHERDDRGAIERL
jgi:hypothetical protein